MMKSLRKMFQGPFTKENFFYSRMKNMNRGSRNVYRGRRPVEPPLPLKRMK